MIIWRVTFYLLFNPPSARLNGFKNPLHLAASLSSLTEFIPRVEVLKLNTRLKD